MGLATWETRDRLRTSTVQFADKTSGESEILGVSGVIGHLEEGKQMRCAVEEKPHTQIRTKANDKPEPEEGS